MNFESLILQIDYLIAEMNFESYINIVDVYNSCNRHLIITDSVYILFESMQ